MPLVRRSTPIGFGPGNYRHRYRGLGQAQTSATIPLCGYSSYSEAVAAMGAVYQGNQFDPVTQKQWYVGWVPGPGQTPAQRAAYLAAMSQYGNVGCIGSAPAAIAIPPNLPAAPSGFRPPSSSWAASPAAPVSGSIPVIAPQNGTLPPAQSNAPASTVIVGSSPSAASNAPAPFLQSLIPSGSGSFLSSIPVWAWIAGAAGVGWLLFSRK